MKYEIVLRQTFDYVIDLDMPLLLTDNITKEMLLVALRNKFPIGEDNELDDYISNIDEEIIAFNKMENDNV